MIPQKRKPWKFPIIVKGFKTKPGVGGSRLGNWEVIEPKILSRSREMALHIYRVLISSPALHELREWPFCPLTSSTMTLFKSSFCKRSPGHRVSIRQVNFPTKVHSEKAALVSKCLIFDKDPEFTNKGSQGTVGLSVITLPPSLGCKMPAG